MWVGGDEWGWVEVSVGGIKWVEVGGEGWFWVGSVLSLQSSLALPLI